MRVGICKNRHSRRIAGYRSMTGGVRTTATVHHREFIAQTTTHQWLFVCHNQHGRLGEEKKTEQNSFVRSDKSEAEVTHNRRLRSTYCTMEANYTDKDEASRGLSAITGLLVIWGRKLWMIRPVISSTSSSASFAFRSCMLHCSFDVYQSTFWMSSFRPLS